MAAKTHDILSIALYYSDNYRLFVCKPDIPALEYEHPDYMMMMMPLSVGLYPHF